MLDLEDMTPPCCEATYVSESSAILMQSIANQSRNFIFAIDIDFTVQVLNVANVRFFNSMGIDMKIGGHFPDYIKVLPEHEISQKIQHLRRALSGERFSTLESWNEVIYQTEYAPLYHPQQGHIIGAVFVGRLLYGWDVTESEIPENTVTEFFWPHVVLFGTDPEAKFFSHQPSWESFTGQTYDEYSGLGWILAFHPDYRTRIWEMWQKECALKRTDRKPKSFSFMSSLWNASMSMYRYTLIHVTPQFDMQGNMAYWTCSGIDVHELRQNQEDLALAKQRLNVILQAGQVGTWDWDLETGQMKTSTTHCRTFGRDATKSFQAEELMSQIIDRQPVEVAIQNTIENGVPYDVEFKVKWPDGSLHWVGSRGELYRASDGRESLISVNWDMTGRKQMEEERVRFLKHEEEILRSKQAEEYERKRAEEAEENQRRQEEFIDTVCHEIRNPLVGIYGGVHLATEELTYITNSLRQFDSATAVTMERMKNYLKSILKCAEQQKVILDDVLDMSKLHNNKIKLIPVPFQLSACMEHVIDMFRSRVQEKNLKMNANLPEDEIFLKADMNRLQQVIINLVSNAIKFTHEGEITITANVLKIDQQWNLEVAVQDTGIGILEEEIPLLFDRFSQVGFSYKRIQYGGSGLGLAISKRLVEAMGGSLSVASKIGQGSTFTFRIKFDEVQETDIRSLLKCYDQEDEGDVTWKCSMNILVVDDNTLNQKILATYLEKAGHCVQVASDGMEAVQKTLNQHYDIIFMDIEMPKMNGLEATVTIRQREKELNCRSVIIGVSGNARKEKIDEALEVGMDCYLTKPYHKDEITKAVAKFAQYGKIRPRIRKHSAEELQQTSKFQKLEFK